MRFINNFLEVRKCIQCGACTSVCPVSKATKKFNPRLLMYAAKRGMIVKSDDVWFCIRCHACEAKCPNSIKIPDIITYMRGKILEEGHEKRVVESYLDTVKAVFDSGLTIIASNNKIEEFKAEKGLNLSSFTEEIRSELWIFLRKINLEKRLKDVMKIDKRL